jgi:transcriptional regulator with XRE-family HTH domain
MLELKKWAVERGIKQKDLAKILDVSPQLITEWFAFRRAPTGEKVIEIQELIKTKPRVREMINFEEMEKTFSPERCRQIAVRTEELRKEVQRASKFHRVHARKASRRHPLKPHHVKTF